MPYIGYERIEATGSVKDVDDLDIPNEAQQAELQADTQNVRYRMDKDGANPAENSGMLFLTTSEPKLFLIEDVRNIRFIKDGANSGFLNIHYLTGRKIV